MREATHLPRPQMESEEMLTFISGTDLDSNSNLSLPSGKEIRQGLPHIFFQTLLYMSYILLFSWAVLCFCLFCSQFISVRLKENEVHSID